MDTVWIYHTIAIWDECDHVSAKHSSKHAENFWAGYFQEFPEANACVETPGVIATGSPIFNPAKVSSFVHEGALVPHVDKAKDMAIARFCSTGFVDQDDRFHFLVDDLRELRRREGQAPMEANSAVAIVLITSDLAPGMTQALNWVATRTKAHRTNFRCIRLTQEAAQGSDRMLKAGRILGRNFKGGFVRIENGGLLLTAKHQPVP